MRECGRVTTRAPVQMHACVPAQVQVQVLESEQELVMAARALLTKVLANSARD